MRVLLCLLFFLILPLSCQIHFPSFQNFSCDLPIVIIDTHQQIPERQFIKVSFRVIWNKNGSNNVFQTDNGELGFDGEMLLKKRGANLHGKQLPMHSQYAITTIDKRSIVLMGLKSSVRKKKGWIF